MGTTPPPLLYVLFALIGLWMNMTIRKVGQIIFNGKRDPRGQKHVLTGKKILFALQVSRLECHPDTIYSMSFNRYFFSNFLYHLKGLALNPPPFLLQICQKLWYFVVHNYACLSLKGQPLPRNERKTPFLCQRFAQNSQICPKHLFHKRICMVQA